MIRVRQYIKGQVITEPGVYSGVEIDRYHGGRLCDGDAISSSGLRTIFGESPMDYWIESPLNPNRVEPKEKDAFTLGRATHHLALGEDRFDRLFVEQPEETPDGKKWNNNSNLAKAWNAEQALAGKTILKPDHVEKIKGMAGVLPWQRDLVDSGLANSRLVKEGGILNGLIEHTIAFRDRKTGVWLLNRPDAMPVETNVGADLKTTTRVDYRSLQMTMADYRYDMQAALARMALREVCGIDLEHCALVFVMTKPPHAVQVVEIKQRDMDEAEKDIRVAIDTFARCRESGRWPGPGGLQTDGMYVEIGKWARDRADMRRIFLTEDHPV